ncbi:MAG: 5' nucleotidase, NT5C type [Clostridia bacterium]
MRIGIDIDGVLTDEHRFIIDYGTKYLNNKKIEYTLHDNIYDDPKIFEITKSQYDAFWKKYLVYYSENISIRPFAAEVIKKLKQENNEIYIITSRSFTTYENQHRQKMQDIVKKWLNKNDVKYDEIIFSRNKADICRKMHIDVMIEDKPENVIAISKIIPVICYDHPYNNELSDRNIIRSYSWYDIYKKIKEM